MGSDEETGPPRTPDAPPGVSLDAIPLHSANLLTVLDESGVIQYESPAIERVFGFDQAELVGERVAEYFHPEDREAVVGAFRAVVSGDPSTVESVEYRHERADGTYCWVESVASADPTPEGHYVVNTRDVSDRKARERELVRTNERLDEFARVLSHDLRNPLQVAQGQLELVAERRDSEHLAEVERAHDRMGTLIDDLLVLANDGATVTDPEPVDLASVVDDCWRTVETGDATLVTATERAVRADRSRLQQLFENLFRNAVEHGSTGNRTSSDDSVEHGSTSSRPPADDAVEHGGPGVTIEVGDLDDGFYVADDGPGIPEAERDRVFERGYSAAEGGTGIGLSIVERITRAHCWEIGVTESDEGGAQFEFTGVEVIG